MVIFFQEFDRQASAKVKQMFDEIDGMLFEGESFNGRFTKKFCLHFFSTVNSKRKFYWVIEDEK